MNSELATRIADAIAPHRKMTERMVGAIPYTLHYEEHEFHGISQKPGKLSSIEKCITKLAAKGIDSRKQMAEYLGLRTEDNLEADILDLALDEAKKHNLIILHVNRLLITPQGQEVANGGEYLVQYKNKFSLVIVPEHLSLLNLNQCGLNGNAVSNTPAKYKPIKLTLAQIQQFADRQASHVHHKDSGLVLIEAQRTEWALYSYDFYVCFLQSIKDNSIRTLFYDERQNRVLPQLSTVIDENPTLRDELLTKCLDGEVKTQEIKEVASGEKSEEQLQAEATIVELEEKGESVSPVSSTPKPGTLFDSLQFEKQLFNIFKIHQNEEIWMISPWIRDYAFLKVREPMIRAFLDDGGAVFIAYSEPERLGEEMVDPQSRTIIRRLEKNYEKFYVISLPIFHNKNVIEYNEGVATLYSGSFNILSFSVKGHEKHYRKEDMMVANEEEAVKKRDAYLREFAAHYLRAAHEASAKDGANKDTGVDKLKYFQRLEILEEVAEKLAEQLAKEAERQERGITSDLENIDDDERCTSEDTDYSQIAEYIIKKYAPTDTLRVKAILSALFYAYEHTDNTEKSEWVKGRIIRFLNNAEKDNSCRYTLRPDKEDNKKSIVGVIIDGVCYEFKGLSLPSNTFKLLFSKKQSINYKEEGLRGAKFMINDLIRSAIDDLDIEIKP